MRSRRRRASSRNIIGQNVAIECAAFDVEITDYH